MIQIKQLTLYHLSMRLKKPFKSSLETFQDRKFIIVEAADQEGVTGWGKYPLFHLRGTPKKQRRHATTCSKIF